MGTTQNTPYKKWLLTKQFSPVQLVIFSVNWLHDYRLHGLGTRDFSNSQSVPRRLFGKMIPSDTLRFLINVHVRLLFLSSILPSSIIKKFICEGGLIKDLLLHSEILLHLRQRYGSLTTVCYVDSILKWVPLCTAYAISRLSFAKHILLVKFQNFSH